jgi:cysteine desulfurase
VETIYLDNNATTRPAPEVVAAMVSMLTEWYGNPSSVHRFGQRARQALDQARAQVAALIGCSDSELIFTGGGTEGVNTAIRGLLSARFPRRRIVTTTVEHSATRQLCQQLGAEVPLRLCADAEIVLVPVDARGNLDLGAWAAAMQSPQVALATSMWANNETGVIFPIAKMAALCKEQGVPFHCDGTQAVGKIAVNVKTAGVDAMSFASHKFHGPKGVGGLFIRRGLRIPPLIIGGPQEKQKRGGTENVPGAVGMGVAAELAAGHLGDMAKVAGLRDRLEDAILATIPETAINGDRANRVPNTSNIGFAQLEAEAILLLLSERGICASAGAACASGSLEPSHVLKAMKVPEATAHGAIRFSLSRYTTDAEIERTLQVLPVVIDKLRKVLPVGV